MQSAEPVLDVQPRLCRGKVAGEPGDRKRSCRGSGEGALEKGLERHLAGVPISPRSKRTRASRRGRHRISRPRRPSSIPACPTAFSTQEFPCARCPLLREPGGNSCGKDFHAPNRNSRRAPAGYWIGRRCSRQRCPGRWLALLSIGNREAEKALVLRDRDLLPSCCAGRWDGPTGTSTGPLRTRRRPSAGLSRRRSSRFVGGVWANVLKALG